MRLIYGCYIGILYHLYNDAIDLSHPLEDVLFLPQTFSRFLASVFFKFSFFFNFSNFQFSNFFQVSFFPIFKFNFFQVSIFSIFQVTNFQFSNFFANFQSSDFQFSCIDFFWKFLHIIFSQIFRPSQ